MGFHTGVIVQHGPLQPLCSDGPHQIRHGKPFALGPRQRRRIAREAIQLGENALSGEAVEDAVEAVEERLEEDPGGHITWPVEWINEVLVEAQEVVIVHVVAEQCGGRAL